jgi:serine/threonine-protein kinase
MASVYKAYEAGLDRYVALKVLPPEFLHDETFAERFRHEAKAVAKLEHPNIVPIYAFDIEKGQPWMAMRLVPGGALSSVVKRGRLDPARAVRILRGSADALGYAHSKKIVHRDVKPQNILLDENERVYLADFGIAKMLEGSSKLTATGMISGTPQYMAPEQATAAKVDARADIYALGIVAYELLTGRVPFAADTPVAVLMKHVQDPIPLPSPSEVTEPLVRVLLKALAKNPDDRWATAVDFVAALEAALHDVPTAQALPTLEMTGEQLPPTRPAATVPPRAATLPARRSAPTTPATQPPTSRSNSTVLAAAIAFGGLAVLVLAGVGAFWLLRTPARDSRTVPSPLPEGVTVAANAAVAPAATLAASAVTAPPAPPATASPVVTVVAPPATLPPTRGSARTPPHADGAPPATIPASPPRATTAPPAPTTLAPAPPAAAGPSPEVESLMESLGDRSTDTRWKAAESLGNLGPEAQAAAPRLIEALSDRSDVVRWRSAEALGKIGTAQAAGPLAAALKDRDPLVRTEAAKALGSLGGQARVAVAQLGQALSDPEVYCRRAAAKALGSLAPDSRAALPALVQALQDKDKFVRLQSAKALGSLGPAGRDAAPGLTAATKDGEPLVARAAAEALKRIAGDGGPVS